MDVPTVVRDVVIALSIVSWPVTPAGMMVLYGFAIALAWRDVAGVAEDGAPA